MRIIEFFLRVVNKEGMAYLCHSTINHEIGTVNEATLITSQEDNSSSLLNSLSETSSGKVNFSSQTLGGIIAQPILKKRSTIITLLASRTRV